MNQIHDKTGGNLPGFLIEDANVTRKAFTRWFRETFIKSFDGYVTTKAVKNTIHGLYRNPAGLAVDRGSQQPEVRQVISQWEGIPLEEGSREWNKARIRFIRDLLFARSLEHFEGQGFRATEPEIKKARHWFRKSPDGTLTTYQSLPLLCKYKDLRWDESTRTLKTVVAADLQPDPSGTGQGAADPETIRISNQTFNDPLASNGRGPEHQANDDEELIDVSEDEADDELVPWKDIPEYIGEGTREEPFLEDRMEDPPDGQHVPAILTQTNASMLYTHTDRQHHFTHCIRYIYNPQQTSQQSSKAFFLDYISRGSIFSQSSLLTIFHEHTIKLSKHSPKSISTLQTIFLE
ncbi:MAG: hypothetical protein LQ350_003278 [Teloschistes chrysophthalmus]|nr:MAG: hypothetical protein LQ350_003278 [Niorma chrysophthalma]